MSVRVLSSRRPSSVSIFVFTLLLFIVIIIDATVMNALSNAAWNLDAIANSFDLSAYPSLVSPLLHASSLILKFCCVGFSIVLYCLSLSDT